MSNFDEKLDCVSQIVTNQQERELYLSVLDINYAYNQLDLAAETSTQCNSKILSTEMSWVHIDY